MARSMRPAARSRPSGASSGSIRAMPAPSSGPRSAATGAAAISGTRAGPSGRRASRRPGAPSADDRPTAPIDERTARPMKIGLITPYVYPLPGGVNEHVRYLYENLRLRGHDVRIISSSHGLQRSSEGDVVRLGKGFSFPANGSVGTITVSPRYMSQVRSMLEAEHFDLLHFHEPFVPFLSPILLRLSTSVNVATFHAYGGFSPAYEFGSRFLGGYARRLHGRIAVSAAARHFIDRYFPGDYKVIPNGVDVLRYERAVPLARWQDGHPNLLFVGRHEPRKGLLELLKAYRILRTAGCDCRLLIVGTGPQEREARRDVLTRRLEGVHFLGRVSDVEK